MTPITVNVIDYRIPKKGEYFLCGGELLVAPDDKSLGTYSIVKPIRGIPEGYKLVRFGAPSLTDVVLLNTGYLGSWGGYEGGVRPILKRINSPKPMTATINNQEQEKLLRAFCEMNKIKLEETE